MSINFCDIFIIKSITVSNLYLLCYLGVLPHLLLDQLSQALPSPRFATKQETRYPLDDDDLVAT
jgi:hypothetical protein